MKKILFSVVVGILMSSVSHGELVGRLPATPGGTDFRAVYDTDLDITWLADANAGAGSAFDDGASASDGLMTWANAVAWAESYSLEGFTDWRLPTTLQPDPACDAQGNNGSSSGFNCTGSEMGHTSSIRIHTNTNWF